jgi:manganese-dependent inorganic pyrophosphatase
MNIYIIGHKSPDLDAVASAVQYADFLKKAKRFEGSKIIPLRAGEPNIETKYVFDKFDVEMPQSMDDVEINAEDAIVLVDHNEEAQRHEKIVGDQVIEIVDHHKINVSFTTPVRIDVRPVGSTSTVVYKLFDMYGLTPSEKTQSLILAGILSDTVGLKSSTTTGIDSDIARDISEKLDIDVEKFTFEIFKAKSDLSSLTPIEIAKKDFKVFDFEGTKVFVNQVETVEPEKAIEQKKDLVEALEEAKTQEEASHGYIVVTDILKINSQVIYTNDVEKEIIEKAFTTEGEDNVADIGPRMSRKKDITPPIEKVILGN